MKPCLNCKLLKTCNLCGAFLCTCGECHECKNKNLENWEKILEYETQNYQRRNEQ
jgi:hypothetical protein